MDVFENATNVVIHNKEVQSIKTLEGKIIWEKPSPPPTPTGDYMTITVTGDSISFQSIRTGSTKTTVHWGDNTTTDINNSMNTISHTYTDGLSEHTIIFEGVISSLESNAFKNCTGLKTFYAPVGLGNIFNDVFSGCTNLISVSIPPSVSSIGTGIFTGCTSLIRCDLYWTSNIRNVGLPDNENLEIYIPNGTTQSYVSAGYSSDKLVERSE